MHIRRVQCRLPAAALSLVTCLGVAGCGGGEERGPSVAAEQWSADATAASPSARAESTTSALMIAGETMVSSFETASDEPDALEDEPAYTGTTPGGSETYASATSPSTSIGTTATPQAFALAAAKARASSKTVAGAASESGKLVQMAAIGKTDAFRFLSQATFGPSPASMAELQSKTYDQWLDDQMAAPWQALMPRVKTQLGAGTANPSQYVISAFWQQAIGGQAQLRWRTAFALSQIFVYSVSGNAGYSYPVASADYFDLLARNAFGNYRQLLESVARHPAMGRYLSHLGNRPDDDKTGRVPDENFAREIMQLFSIGLYKLNLDGTLQLNARGNPIPTYDADDIAGMARVFTGLSWDCGDGRSAQCFLKTPFKMGDSMAGTRPMIGYPEFHSTEEKRFLGVIVPAQSSANPDASLKVALDTLANHPNVGPFIGRQLIQRLVTSNPSPAYVADVAAVFNNNGRGVRGDLGAVVRKILTHSEARTIGAHQGRVREPVLRLTALARAFSAHSLSGEYVFPSSEVYDSALGQVPLSSPSVFNYYRPGYVARGGGLARARMVAPEMQIVDENSVASYVRYMRQAIEKSFGAGNGSGNGRDMELDLSAVNALAGQPEQMVDLIFNRLLGDGDYPELRAEVQQTVKSIVIPTPVKGSDGEWAIGVAKTKRMRIAMLMTLAAPEFIVQH